MAVRCAIVTWACAVLLAGCGNQNAQTAQTPDERPVVVIETSKGIIEAELWPDRAPQTVKNFLKYVDDGFYDGLIFHRVLPDQIIQGGGFTPDMREKPTHPPIRNEATRANRNLKGTLAMARTNDPHSASSEFFINVVTNADYDHRAPTREGYGYCVFGQVTRGMRVVEAISKVDTHNVGHYQNVPVTAVIIRSIRRKK